MGSYLEDKASKAADAAAEKADSRLNALLEKFAEIQMKVLETAAKSSLQPDQLEQILSRVGMESAKGMQKAIRPENEMPPLISAYNPHGDRDYPKRKLTRKTFLNYHPEHSNDALVAEQLTQAEIDAYNRLGEACAAQGGHLEARNGLYKAELRLRGQELHVLVPVANLDTRANLPPTLLLLCHELQTGESMLDLNNLLEENSRLRMQIAAMKEPAPSVSRSATSSQFVTITAQAGPLVKDLEEALESTPASQLEG